MRRKKVEGEYQIDSWPKGPESSLCPLARPDIAMGLESQIEAWSARSSRILKPPGSHRQIASNGRRTTTVSKSATTCHRLRDDHPAGRRGGLGCQGQRHRGRERYTLDIPLHRRDLWVIQYPAIHPIDSSAHSHRSFGRNDTEGSGKGGIYPAPTNTCLVLSLHIGLEKCPLRCRCVVPV